MATHAYDNGGQPDGMLGVSIASFYGDECVCIELVNGDSAAHLTADQALALAADLIAHANALRKPSACKCAGVENILRCDTADEFAGVCVVCRACGREFGLTDVSEPDPSPSGEDLIRDAMAEAEDHPGRIVTR